MRRNVRRNSLSPYFYKRKRVRERSQLFIDEKSVPWLLLSVFLCFPCISRILVSEFLSSYLFSLPFFPLSSTSKKESTKEIVIRLVISRASASHPSKVLILVFPPVKYLVSRIVSPTLEPVVFSHHRCVSLIFQSISSTPLPTYSRSLSLPSHSSKRIIHPFLLTIGYFPNLSILHPMTVIQEYA